MARFMWLWPAMGLLMLPLLLAGPSLAAPQTSQSANGSSFNFCTESGSMKRFFYFVKKHSARFLTAIDGSMEMKVFSAELGQVVVNDSSQSLSDAEIAENIERALQFGFLEVSEADFSKEQVRIKKEFQQFTIEPIIPGTKLISWQDLKSDFKQYLTNDPDEYLSSKLRSFCVYEEPCQLNGDLRIAFDSKGPTAQTAGRNLIFKQGLTIDGNFDAGSFTTELPQLVIVKGDLHAKNLILTGWVEVIVTGDVKVEGVLFGNDGEAGGRLKVHGNMSAKQIFGGMMYNIDVSGQTTGSVYWTDDDDPTLPNSTIIPSTVSQEQLIELMKHTPLVKEAYLVESNWATGEEVQTLVLTPSQVVEIIREGKPLFNDATK